MREFKKFEERKILEISVVLVLKTGLKVLWLELIKKIFIEIFFKFKTTFNKLCSLEFSLSEKKLQFFQTIKLNKNFFIENINLFLSHSGNRFETKKRNKQEFQDFYEILSFPLLKRNVLLFEGSTLHRDKKNSFLPAFFFWIKQIFFLIGKVSTIVFKKTSRVPWIQQIATRNFCSSKLYF